jgi:hypothetical protein
VQVRHDEGVANHVGPEPCATAREGRGEASAGERIGQPLSREINSSREPTACGFRKATRAGALSQASAHSARSQTLACADAPCPGTGRPHHRPWAATPMVRTGKARSRSR